MTYATFALIYALTALGLSIINSLALVSVVLYLHAYRKL